MEENRSIDKSIAQKRKLQDELSETPSPKKVQYDTISRGGESRPESTSSNSFNFSTDDDEAKNDLSDFPTSSSSSSDATFSDFSLYSSDIRSSTYTNSSEPESSSINKQPDCSSSHEKGGDDQECIDMVLENLVYSNGVPSSSNDYIISSGRWPVNQDSQQKSKKLTIDKEFEKYFSELML
ncbi:hypothetical protein ACS0TY_016037 [Phlomoides rotata]